MSDFKTIFNLIALSKNPSLKKLKDLKMSNKRSLNVLSQMRINTSHLRSIESANRNDFDELFNAVFTGVNKSYVIRGFEVSMPGSILSSASGLTLLVADGAILHGNSASSGTFFLADSAASPESWNFVRSLRSP